MMAVLTAPERKLHRLVEDHERTHGPVHPETARVLTQLADICARQHCYDDAYAYYARAVAILELAERDEEHLAAVRANARHQLTALAPICCS